LLHWKRRDACGDGQARACRFRHADQRYFAGGVEADMVPRSWGIHGHENDALRQAGVYRP
jgi:hypothetical protein